MDSSISETSEIFVEEYHQAIASLKQDFKSQKSRNQVEIKLFMQKALARRREWITSERPLVSEVVKDFPALRSTKVVVYMLTVQYQVHMGRMQLEGGRPIRHQLARLLL